MINIIALSAGIVTVLFAVAFYFFLQEVKK